MKCSGYGRSDVGRERGNNEDSFFVDDALGLFVVCDGMGGHKGGEVASHLATEAVAREIAAKKDDLSNSPDTATITEAVAEAVQAANRDVFARGSAEPSLEGMGCAMTVLLARGHSGYLGQVGDTRLYVMRDGAVKQVSRDHTMAEELVRSGSVPAEAQDRIPHGHVLTRAIGVRETVDVEVTVVRLVPGDRYLLCSDGLSGYLNEGEILERHLGADDASGIPDALVQWANECGGRDNITAVVVDVEPE